MINKEEAEKIKRKLAEELENTIEANQCGLSTNDFSENIETLETALEYIQQLETKQQKVIDYLEKEKYTIESTYSQINGNYFMSQDRLDLINKVLEIMKGEEK